MRGGEDSRIPAFLAPHFDVMIKTWPFDPDEAAPLVRSWADEFKPDVVVGESLGAIHALCLEGLPVLLVSPALNAPEVLAKLSFLTAIPAVRRFYERKYAQKSPVRQRIIFERTLLKKWPQYRDMALSTPHPYVHAFIGTRDSYRRSGTVSLRTYHKFFGDTYTLYEGTHYMEEEFLESLLIPAIRRCRP